MTTLKSILVTTDFSEAAHRATCRAALIAAEHGAELTLLNVEDPSSFRALRGRFSARSGFEEKIAHTKARLERVAQALGAKAGVRVTPLARVGNPLEQIRAVAQDADLMVVGAKNGNALRAFVLGTPAERLLRLFRLPVLLAREAVTGAYRHILVPTDLGASARHQLHAAMRLFPAAGIHLFHALTGGATSASVAQSASTDAQKASPEMREQDEGLRALKSLTVVAGGSNASLTVAEGDPSLLSLQRQQAVQADLIVIGKDGQSTFGEYLLGRVAQRILARAKCDVLVTPRIPMQRTT